MPDNAKAPVGLYIIGEMVGEPTPGREYTDKANNKHYPATVDLLVGRYVERIEFDSMAEAQAVIHGAELRSIVTIPVRARGGWDSTNRRWGRVSYSGRLSE